MRFYTTLLLLVSVSVFQSCSSSRKSGTGKTTNRNERTGKSVPARTINTKFIAADSVVDFAETLIGIPYKYGSVKKEEGFDCSGFITYVFNHFNISVPRSSVDFTNTGKEVPVKDARRGDLILFTGSDRSSGVVGHMGIITENKKGKPLFIHSASGNNKGVMISGLNSYFEPRVVKVIRVFEH